MSEVSEKDVFLEAIKVLDEHGWYQGDFWPRGLNRWDSIPEVVEKNLPVCMLGAVTLAIARNGIEDADGSLYSSAYNFLARCTNIGPAEYNDDPDRTLAEVKEALRCAAELVVL